ncbi:MAG: hypothetical protein M1837_000560 [Sclerophora amabilis]|nr:MAG: hypothetical protein M1837_000560 [Sclerophora amabilis]
MPTFWTRSTNIHLSVTKQSSNTGSDDKPDGTSTRLGAESPTSVSPQTQEILAEESFPAPGEPGDLRFLGEQKNMPFYLVRADPQSFRAEARSVPLKTLPIISSGPGDEMGISRAPSTPVHVVTRSRTTAGTVGSDVPDASSATPRALSISISLSKGSFILPIQNQTKGAGSTASPKKRAGEAPDIYAVVYFNGELASSTFVPARCRHSLQAGGDYLQVFSGRRIDLHKERAWVLNASPRENKGDRRRGSGLGNIRYGAAARRWEQVSLHLKEEACRWNETAPGGAKSLMESYLKSLADLKMPVEMECIQNRTIEVAAYGIVDVILLLGKGEKDGSTDPYPKNPPRLLDPRHCGRARGEPQKEINRAQRTSGLRLKLPMVQDFNRTTEPFKGSEETPDQGQRLKLFTTQSTMISPPRQPSVGTTLPLTDSSATSDGCSPVSGNAGTPLESNSRRPVVSHQSAQWSTPTVSSDSRDFAGAKGDKINHVAAGLQSHTHSIQQDVSASPFSFPGNISTTPSLPRDSPMPDPKPLRTRPRSSQAKIHSSPYPREAPSSVGRAPKDSGWTPTSLNANCVIGYANGVTTDVQVDASGARYTRKEKGGTFRADEVLMGTRFVVY